ncbi:LytR family transcriptional attenuator [Anoxybacillus vitaminiphilus]|uniref:LytR family transcriptional attenuator n=1 Tax=Paranoxybacillus vitaminiphilus TaxID=581036 RepID=A0A327YNX8_9BACL|nr:LCP family protein [Anoxybacillus vitaminiphilus]RAK19909.1 LytR family transcriptional attenuator [Anoxybacillus vitaminiphilus]
MSINRRDRKTQKKKRKRRRIVKWMFFTFLFFILAGSSYAYYLLHKAESVVNKSYEAFRPDAKKRDLKQESFSILFIGVDDSRSRKFHEATRTDALILATFNPKNDSVKMVSIPRDSYVYIPSEDSYDKINHAHVYDGVKGTVETVEELFDIKIDYYVKMNFYAFIDVVDALGGIEVNVPYDITEKDSEDHHNAIVLKKGLQTLNGEEALALARTRKKDNDIERGKRQQEIIKAIVKKAATMGAVTKYDDVIEAVGKNMKTNLTFDEMMSLVSYATAGANLNIESYTLKGTDDYVGNAYVYRLDEQSLEEIKQAFKHHLAGTAYTSNDHSYTQQAKEDENSQQKQADQ